MSGRYVLSPAAQGDIENIWNYTVERWGISQAESYIRQMWQHIQEIAHNPALGRECFEVRAGYYQYPSGSHLLFFRHINGGVDIVRILHQRMDFERHF